MEGKIRAYQELIAQSDELIQQAKSLLEEDGTTYPLANWVTPAAYAKRFGLTSTNVVGDWIRRGVIPAENIIHLPELDDIQLINLSCMKGV